MDALGSLLDGSRARGAFLLRVIMRPPWSVRVEDEAPLTLVAMVEGEAWVVPDHGDPERIGPGGAAIMRGPAHYTFADDPATEPQVVIHPGQRCTTPEGEPVHEAMHLGMRTWGNSQEGSATILIGTYDRGGEVSKRLLAALPAQVVLADDAWSSRLIPLLAEEIVKEEPGQEAVLDRIVDLLLVAALRAWFARAAAAPGWYRAQSDPIVGVALRLIQNNPAHPWTVAKLAAEAGVSRSGLARRFVDLVGEPPMTFLTGWRLALAADLLQASDATVGAVAHDVGYGSAFALSTAFKRVRGVSPREHRGRTRLMPRVTAMSA